MTQAEEKELLQRVTKLEQDRDAHRTILQNGGGPADEQLAAIRSCREAIAALERRLGEMESRAVSAPVAPVPSTVDVDVTLEDTQAGSDQ